MFTLLRLDRLLRRWLEEHRPDAVLTDHAGIYQNPEDIGRVGVLMLQSLINDNARVLPAINRQVLIEGTWVEGRSLPIRLAADAR